MGTTIEHVKVACRRSTAALERIADADGIGVVAAVSFIPDIAAGSNREGVACLRDKDQTCLPTAHDIVHHPAFVRPLLALAERQLIEAIQREALADIEDSVGELILFGDDILVAERTRTTTNAVV